MLIFFWPLLKVQAQENIPRAYKEYQETVWLECERHLYFPGEIVRFSVNVFENDTYKNSSLSNIIRIELLNALGEPVNQQNIFLNNSEAKGLVQLPADSKTGYYYLRAYTNWMRNFSPSNYGKQTLKVVNPNEPLPEIKEEGYEIASPKTNPYFQIAGEDQKLSISISNKAFENSDSLRLAIHQTYTIILDTIFTNSMDTELIVFEKDLPNGIFQVSLLNKDNRIIGKQLWSFYQPESEWIDITMADSLLEIRNSYSINFPNSTTLQGLKVSIGLEEPYNPYNNFIPGLPGWPCNAEIPNSSEALKNWLYGNSYPDDQVYAILENSKNELKDQKFLHLPETHSGVISGKVFHIETNDEKANTGVCLTVLNDNYFDAVNTDEKGHFFFVLPGYSGSTDIIINLTTFEDTSLQIELMPFFDPNTVIDYKELTLTKAEFDFLKNQNLNQQLKNIYNTIPTVTSSQLPPAKTRETFFHPPDFTRFVDKYIKLVNIGEVIYEVVPKVSVRKKNGREKIQVYNQHPSADIFETLVLLDGIPLADQSVLLDLPPERIETIEVKNKLYIHGRRVFSAVVNFVSPNKDYAGLELPENSVLTTMELPVLANYEINNDGELSKNLPNLENSLLWCSEIINNSDSVEFQTNDLKGVFRIYVKGFDSQGRWKFGTRQFWAE